MSLSKILKIYGPPGTGKTTTLLNLVDKAIEDGITPNRIAFVAFSRKAAQEARDRARKRFELDDDSDLHFFRTLHSFAYQLSDIKQNQLLTDDHLSELGLKIGFNLSRKAPTEPEDGISAITSGESPVMQIIQLSRLKREPVDITYNESTIEETLQEVIYAFNSYKKYKQSLKLYDYTDILEYFVSNNGKFCPHFDVVFVDEAQDLSKLQWEMVNVILEKSKKAYIAGDDDQAIFRWAGADVESLLTLDSPSEVLSQSYRVPQSVHQVAERIVSRIKNRRIKKYLPHKIKGSVNVRISAPVEEMSKGTWLVLAQCAYMLQEITENLKSYGVLFEYKNKKSINHSVAIAVLAWKSLQNDQKIYGTDLNHLYTWMKTNTRVKRGYKKLPNVEMADEFTYQDLVTNMGLKADIDMNWDIALDRLPEEESSYISALLRRGQKIDEDPKIKISTIHGAKGGEAENVVVYTDISRASDEARMSSTAEGFKITEDLHRLFYVAVTRTKENLYLITPEDAVRSYQI